MSLLNQVLRDLDAQAEPQATPELTLAQTSPEPPAGAMPVRLEPDWGRLVAWTATAGAVLIWAAGWFFVQAPQAPPVAVKANFAAAGMLQEAVRLEAGSEEFIPLKITRDPQHAQPRTPVLPIRESKPANPEPVAAEKPVSRNTKPAEKKQPPPAIAKPVVKTPQRAKSVAIKKQVSQRIDAGELIAQGELSQAEQLLRERLSNRPADREARELLVGLLLRGGRAVEAGQLIEKGRRQGATTANLELIGARILLEQGDSAVAEQRLQALLTRSPNHADAQRLLAALWQRDGKPEQAARLYRQLVARPGAGSRDWLGLALCMDGSDDPLVLQAFRKAAQGGDLDTATLRYVQQRIRLLQE